MKSTKSGATSAASTALIKESLLQVRQAIAPNSQVDWASNYYQYANRLAHLYWLREVNHLPAYMVFVYFCGDKERRGPETREEWERAIKRRDASMGIKENKLSSYVIDLFVSVRELQKTER